MNNNVARGSGTTTNSKSTGRFGLFVVLAAVVSLMAAGTASAEPAPSISLGGVPVGETQGPGAGDATSAKKPRWYFTATDVVASTITCQVDSGAVTSNCLSPYQPSSNLADGSHTLKISGQDGSSSPVDLTVSFTVDTIAPVASIVDGPSGRSGGDVTFTFGSTESNSTFRCRATGANAFAWRSCLATENLTGLVSGGTVLYVQATDRAGNQSTSVSRSWNVVAEKPDTTLTSHPTVATGSYPLPITRVDNGEFRFRSDDPIATFECRIDDEAWAECTTPFNFSSIVYGDHTFQVRAVNDVGTADPSPASYEWTYAGEPDTSLDATPESFAHSFTADFDFSSTYPDATFQCKLDSGAWGACSSTKTYTGLALLGHTFQVRSVNQLGEVDLSPVTYSWSVVDVPDTAISTSAPAPSFVSSLSVAFSSPYVGPDGSYPATYPGATFECKLDDAAWSACTSPRSLTGLAPGSHTFQVRAVNSVPEVDPSPAEITWTVKEADTSILTKPAAAITARDASFTFTSDANPGATFECKLDSGAWGACSGTRTYSDLNLGSHTFQVRATRYGNTDQTPASYTFVVNTPDTAIGSKPGATSLNRAPSFSFSSPDTTGVTFECKLDSAAFTACTSSKSYSGLSVGSHTFQVRACKFGACDVSPASYTWTIAAPDTTITANPAASTLSRNASFSFSANLSTATFQCRLDGGSWGTCTSPKAYSGLSVGDHTFDVRALNGTGAEDQTPASYDWTVNAPETTILTNPAASTLSRTPKFTFSSNLSSATFQCRLDGGSWGTCTSPKQYAQIATGDHTFEVRALNGTGAEDQTPASYDWTIRKPETTIDSNPAASTTNRRGSFGFSSDLGSATFQCKLDGGDWVACTTPRTFTSNLTIGSHTFQVRAVSGGDTPDDTPATYTWSVELPDTTITAKPDAVTTDRLPSFSFTSDTAGATFQCKRDNLEWATCTSPKSYAPDLLSSGSHTFQVRAVNGLDAVDSTPASYTWTVNCPVYSPTAVLSTGVTVGAVGVQLNAASNGIPVLGSQWGFNLKLTGPGSDSANLATFAAAYRKVDLVIKRNGATTSITRTLTPGNSWVSGFTPDTAGTYTVTAKFTTTSNTVTTRTVSITVNPACS